MEPAPWGGGAEMEDRLLNSGKPSLQWGNRLGQKGSI